MAAVSESWVVVGCGVAVLVEGEAALLSNWILTVTIMAIKAEAVARLFTELIEVRSRKLTIIKTEVV